jgi:hypothetical protein
MPQRIVFEGKAHEFPDDFTDAEISAALGQDDEPGGSAPSGAALGLATASAALPAVVAGGKRLLEEVATRPNFGAGVQKLLGSLPMVGVSARRANVGAQLYDVARGRQSVPAAALDAARNELGQQAIARAPGLLQKLALKAAPRVAGLTGMTAGPIGLGLAAALAGKDAYDYFSSHEPLPRGERLSQREQLERARRAILLRELEARQAELESR